MILEDIIITSKDNQESKFDEIVGALEDILMEEGFHSLMASFCDKYCDEFEDSETNKLEYTIHFNEYTNLVEQYIQTRLKQYDPSFSMEEFLLFIREREEEIIGDVWDILLSLGDFIEFKSMMLAHKQQLQGNAIDVSQFLTVSHVVSK